MFGANIAEDPKYARRREIIFVIISGFFLGSLAMLNILGLSRLIDLSFVIFGKTIPFKVFVGVLPYPLTFLCTDFISELYGRKRANLIVWVGLVLNIWVLVIMWIGGSLPPHHEVMTNGLPPLSEPDWVFFKIRQLTLGATFASMIAYLTAQFIDVHIFHSFKKLTKGKHLWLRNNGSTLVSQLVDSISVVLITHFYAHAVPIEDDNVVKTLVTIIGSSYVFKMVSALFDTIPFYVGVKYLSRYLNIDPNIKFKKDTVETRDS
jgi:hypothetical protein